MSTHLPPLIPQTGEARLRAYGVPWELGELDRNGQRQILGSQGELIATCHHECLGSREPEMEANAAFIVALSAGSPQAPETPAQSDLPDEDVIEIDQDGAVTAVGPLARLKHDLAIERGNVQHLLDTCVPVEELNELREELATLKLALGSAQTPETPSLLARCLAAIETAITDEDGLDGVVGERLLREAGYWPPDPYAASSSDEQAPEKSRTIKVVVNGQPVTVNAGPVRAVIEAAVKASGQIGAPVAQWQLRTRDGDIIPHSLPDEWELCGDTLIFMNLGLPASDEQAEGQR